jgi:hypothetical protein
MCSALKFDIYLYTIFNHEYEYIILFSYSKKKLEKKKKKRYDSSIRRSSLYPYLCGFIVIVFILLTNTYDYLMFLFFF